MDSLSRPTSAWLNHVASVVIPASTNCASNRPSGCAAKTKAPEPPLPPRECESAGGASGVVVFVWHCANLIWIYEEPSEESSEPHNDRSEKSNHDRRETHPRSETTRATMPTSVETTRTQLGILKISRQLYQLAGDHSPPMVLFGTLMIGSSSIMKSSTSFEWCGKWLQCAVLVFSSKLKLNHHCRQRAQAEQTRRLWPSIHRIVFGSW